MPFVIGDKVRFHLMKGDVVDVRTIGPRTWVFATFKQRKPDGTVIDELLGIVDGDPFLVKLPPPTPSFLHGFVNVYGADKYSKIFLTQAEADKDNELVKRLTVVEINVSYNLPAA